MEAMPAGRRDSAAAYTPTHTLAEPDLDHVTHAYGHDHVQSGVAAKDISTKSFMV